MQAARADIKQDNLWEASRFTEKDGNADSAKASQLFRKGEESFFYLAVPNGKWSTAFPSRFFPQRLKGGCLALWMQSECIVFCRALEPASVTRSMWKQQGERLWLLAVWQSGGTVPRAVGPGEPATVAGVALGIPLMVSVPSSPGGHHKMCGEYRPQPSLPLACGRCLQLRSLPQGYLLRPAA